jgi:hypothetical protein
VAAFEKRQRKVEKSRLPHFECKFLPTLRHWAACSELFLVLPTFGLLSDDNPSSTFRTCDARAPNAISHFKIIGRFVPNPIGCYSARPSISQSMSLAGSHSRRMVRTGWFVLSPLPLHVQQHRLGNNRQIFLHRTHSGWRPRVSAQPAAPFENQLVGS